MDQLSYDITNALLRRESELVRTAERVRVATERTVEQRSAPASPARRRRRRRTLAVPASATR